MIMAIAAKRTGSRFKANAARTMKTTPTVPGITAPGWLNSAYSASAPIGQQDERDVRVHDVGEDALLQCHLVVAHRLAQSG